MVPAARPLDFDAVGPQGSTPDAASNAVGDDTDERSLRLWEIALPAAAWTGNPSSGALAETDALELYFKKVETEADKTRGFKTQEEMIVDWSGLVPGYVGLYQVNFIVPPVPPGTPPCVDIRFSSPGNVVETNLTVTIAGKESFDAAGICVEVPKP